MKRILLCGIAPALLFAATSGWGGEAVHPAQSEQLKVTDEAEVEYRDFSEDSAPAAVLLAMGCRAKLRLPGNPVTDLEGEQSDAFNACVADHYLDIEKEIQTRIEANLLPEEQAGPYLIGESIRFVRLHDQRAAGFWPELLERAARGDDVGTNPFTD